MVATTVMAEYDWEVHHWMTVSCLTLCIPETVLLASATLVWSQKYSSSILLMKMAEKQRPEGWLLHWVLISEETESTVWVPPLLDFELHHNDLCVHFPLFIGQQAVIRHNTFWKSTTKRPRHHFFLFSDIIGKTVSKVIMYPWCLLICSHDTSNNKCNMASITI